MAMEAQFTPLVDRLRDQQPLVHNITNFVVMNFTANALLAVGTSPIMAHALEEMETMVSLANALVVNIGTLSTPWIEAMKVAVEVAKKRQIPIILDPVGAGATPLRTRTARELLELGSPLVVRGNASEVCALAHEAGTTKGVDSTLASDQALAAAEALVNRYAATVVISGAVDHIISDKSHIEVHNGVPLMSRVTGTGCVASALLGAFASLAAAPEAATATMVAMGIAGELAAAKAAGPGTFVPYFIDALAHLTDAEVRDRAKVISKA
jgi:hydroxyethylthiazole kinase